MAVAGQIDLITIYMQTVQMTLRLFSFREAQFKFPLANQCQFEVELSPRRLVCSKRRFIKKQKDKKRKMARCWVWID